MSKVTVIIPNYNGLKFLEPCFRALSRQTFRDFSVLVVDNASTDGSLAWLDAYSSEAPAGQEEDLFSFPLEVVRLSENTGFSGAVNEGIRRAESPYVILLNNDTEVFPDYIENLSAAMDADPSGRLFAVSPRMIQLHHPELLDDAGDGYCLLGWAFQRGVGRPVGAPEYERDAAVFSACAGAAIYRKSILEEIRLSEGEYFDLQHFAYLEDMDVSFRARVRGFGIRYCPAAKVLHVGSGTSGSRYNSFKVRLAARNNVFLNVKNMPPLMLLLNLPFLLAGVLIKQLFFVRRGFGKDYFEGFLEGVKRVPELSARRTRFRFQNLKFYLLAELLMLLDTFFYARDLFFRKLLHR